MMREEAVIEIVTSDSPQLTQTPTTPLPPSSVITPVVWPATPPPVASPAARTPLSSPGCLSRTFSSATIDSGAFEADPENEFKRLLTCSDRIKRFKNQDTISRHPRAGDFMLYTLATVHELYAKLGRQSLVRFIVKTNGQLYFAKEGVPTGTNGIPAHHEMDCLDKTAAECITAGNVRLIQTADGIVKINYINHKSGDFRPSFTSLRSLIVILAANPELLADIITLEYLTESGGEFAKVPFAKAKLLDLAARILATGTIPSPETQSVETVTVTRPPLEIRALRTITNTTLRKRTKPGDDTGSQTPHTSPVISPLLSLFDAETRREGISPPAASLLPLFEPLPSATATAPQMQITTRRSLFFCR